MSKIAIIGSGFSGLSTAAYLSAAGHEVHVFEKNESAGGRARQLKTENGYLFDMGPSWYWMPDIFENFFQDFNFCVSELYDLQLLDPSFEIIFSGDNKLSIPADYNELKKLFSQIERGSASALDRFMNEAQFKYDTGMKRLAYMPGISIREWMEPSLIKNILKMQVFTSFSKHVRKYFSNPKLISLMEFPVLFLGATPGEIPALYSLMNYAGLKLGTLYPIGGFGKIVERIQQICIKQKTLFHFNSPVEKIIIERNIANGIIVEQQTIPFDAVVSSADYQYTDKYLLPDSHRNYNEKYWNKRTLAPSCLIFYIGISEKLKNIHHHTLFFDEDLHRHFQEIYQSPQWPSKPSFYVCCPSKTDKSVAPDGHENLFLLMPVAPNLEDNEDIREKYFELMIARLEKHTGEEIKSYIDFRRSYCINNFINDYHAYKGNAYGLANTLRQTSFLKPKIRNKKVANLFYTGQSTVPGPGVPPALISGKIVAQQLLKHLNRNKV